jgi:hypothetical protein
VQGVEPRDWDPQDACAEANLSRTSPWLAVLLIVGVIVLLIIVAVLFTDIVTPLLSYFDDWFTNGP